MLFRLFDSWPLPSHSEARKCIILSSVAPSTSIAQTPKYTTGHDSALKPVKNCLTNINLQCVIFVFCLDATTLMTSIRLSKFTFLFHYPSDSCMGYTYIYHKNQPNVNKFTSRMDPLGYQITFTCFIMSWQTQHRQTLGCPRWQPSSSSGSKTPCSKRMASPCCDKWTSWKKIATVLKVFWLMEGLAFQVPRKKQRPSFHKVFQLNILLYNDAPETDCNNHIQFFKTLVAFWHWLGVEHVTRTARGGMGPTWCRLKLPLANFMNRDDKLGVYKYMYVYVCCVKNMYA